MCIGAQPLLDSGFVMAFSTSGNNGPVSDINVTPLVDVMLVLLVIFMVTAPMMTQGVEVKLPETADAEPLKSDDEKLVLTVTKDRKVYLGTSELPFERISDILSTNARLQEEKELFLHADQDLPYGVVVQVMAAAKKGGAESIAMITDPVAPPPRAKDKEGGR
jgi:biopolymer transport protein TolR